MLLYLSGGPGAYRVSSRIRPATSSLSRRRQGRGLGGADGLSLLKAPQSTQPKKPQRGGPVAQDQTSIQRKKSQGGRRARRPGPVVHPTKEPQGQSPLGELRSAQSTTSTPPHNHKSVTGLGQVSSCGWVFGGRVGGGGRPVTTVKDSSLRTQAVNQKQGRNLQGKDP